MNSVLLPNILEECRRVNRRLNELEERILVVEGINSEKPLPELSIGATRYTNNFNEYYNECFVSEIENSSNQNATSNRLKDLNLLTPIGIEAHANLIRDRVTLHKLHGNWTKESEDELPTPMCVAKTKHNLVYKVLWVVMNLLAVSISFYYIKNAYDAWQSSPVVQALSNNMVHFENISFPAVTICWPNSFNKGYDLFKEYEKCVSCRENICVFRNETCSYQDKAQLELAEWICSNYFETNGMPDNKFDYLPKAIDQKDFILYLEKLVPDCDQDLVMVQISYGNTERQEVTRCDGNFFQQFYSSYPNQLCMTYNGLLHKDIFDQSVVPPLTPKKSKLHQRPNPIWSFDNMMEFKGNQNTVPIYGLDGLFVYIVKQEKKFKNNCNSLPYELASLIIHSPNEIPFHFEYATEYSIENNTAREFMISPQITLAREDLAQYPPTQRNCFFSHEKKLEMFKFYTKRNCDLECLINAFLKHCGCVPFTYPRQNNSVKICLAECSQPKYKCDCLPDCNSLTYDVESQSGAYKNPNPALEAAFAVKLKGNSYYTTIRYSITTYADFLAYSLGILGMFLGFSVTCVWELLFFGLRNIWIKVKLLCNQAILPQH